MRSLDFDKKWASYVLAGGAILGLPAVTHASPILLHSVDSTDIATQGLDIDGDGTIDVTFTADGTPGARTTYATAAGTNMIAMFPSSIDEIKDFSPGATVGSSPNFASSGFFLKDENSTTLKGKWANNINQTSYMGIQFLIGSETHYGWAAVSVQLGSASLDVTDWGYNATANAAATIPGGVPEPSSMALLLLGAAGVSALKLRRKSTQN